MTGDFEPFAVRVSATSANLGPGFDCLGLALDLYNDIHVAPRAAGLDWDIEGEGQDELPRSQGSLFYQAMCRLLPPPPLQIRQTNRIPLSRGLGSSASAIVAGLVAGNRLREQPCSVAELLRHATEMEGHPDNVAAALYGGLTVAYVDVDGNPQALALPFPESLRVVLAIPEVRVSTEAARRVMPSALSLQDAVFSLSRACLLLVSLQTGDLSRLREAMLDRIHTPYRSPLIPAWDQVRAAALDSGARGVFISGSGPTVAALSDPASAASVAAAMKSAFETHGVEARSVVARATSHGASVQR